MKIAVCITGQIREGLKFLDNIYNFCIKDLSPDVYLHTYEGDEINTILDFYKPKKYVLENPDHNYLKIDTCKYVYKDNGCKPSNTLNMWRKRKQVYELIGEELYDTILITRFDAYGHTSITPHLDTDKLCIPFRGNYHRGIFDLCAWGKPDYIKYYCSLYDKIDEYYENKVWFHPETILKHHLVQRPDIQIERVYVPFTLRHIVNFGSDSP
jgi:hypothetical protein